MVVPRENGYLGPTQAARNRETIVIEHDRPWVGESSPVEPSGKGMPQAALLAALWDRYALVKVLQRDARGEWQVAASSQAQTGRLPVVAPGAAPAARDVFAWVADAHRSQVRVALECVARGQPDWLGECETDPRFGLPRWLELHISPLSVGQGGGRAGFAVPRHRARMRGTQARRGGGRRAV
jgi:hypothetical protein